MKQADFDAFHAILSDCLLMWGVAPSAGVTAIWFRTLSGYDLGTLSAAFSAHMRDPANGKFEPKPGHIVEQIERMAKLDGRPGPEEAWAISLSARSEDDTVVWTNECAKAWVSAKPVIDMGDEVGARMAFRETYSRLVAEARARFEAASWEVSEGFDKERRRIAVSEAVEAGRIPAGKYTAIEHSATLLLGGSRKTTGIPDDVRQKLASLREQLTRRHDGPSEADEERKRTDQLKRNQSQKADQFMRGGYDA